MAEVQGRDVSISGMTEPEAREFHAIFVTSFIAFTAIAIVAHILVWPQRLQNGARPRPPRPHYPVLINPGPKEIPPCGAFGCCLTRAGR